MDINALVDYEVAVRHSHHDDHRCCLDYYPRYRYPFCTVFDARRDCYFECHCFAKRYGAWLNDTALNQFTSCISRSSYLFILMIRIGIFVAIADYFVQQCELVVHVGNIYFCEIN